MKKIKKQFKKQEKEIAPGLWGGKEPFGAKRWKKNILLNREHCV